MNGLFFFFPSNERLLQWLYAQERPFIVDVSFSSIGCGFFQLRLQSTILCKFATKPKAKGPRISKRNKRRRQLLRELQATKRKSSSLLCLMCLSHHSIMLKQTKCRPNSIFSSLQSLVMSLCIGL
jgi:hypothetical protein